MRNNHNDSNLDFSFEPSSLLPHYFALKFYFYLLEKRKDSLSEVTDIWDNEFKKIQSILQMKIEDKTRIHSYTLDRLFREDVYRILKNGLMIMIRPFNSEFLYLFISVGSNTSDETKFSIQSTKEPWWANESSLTWSKISGHYNKAHPHHFQTNFDLYLNNSIIRENETDFTPLFEQYEAEIMKYVGVMIRQIMGIPHS